MGIDIEGTNVKVNIVKADKAPNIIDNSDYCNIVASKAGIIKKIIAQNGTAIVKVGDQVQKGDILIAGYMEGKYTDTRYVHSLGEVEAIVSYQKSKEIKFFNQEENRNYTLGEAIEIGKNELTLDTKKEFGEKEIFDTRIDTEEHDDGVIVKIIYDVLESIGEEQKIE